MQMARGHSPQGLRDNPNTGRKYTKTSRLMCDSRHGENCVNVQWILCDSRNPPLALEWCIWAIAHQVEKVLTKGVPRGTH